MRGLIVIFAALAALVPHASALAQDGTVDKSDNVELIYSDEYGNVTGTGSQPFFRAGTDLAFDGDIVIAPQQGPQGSGWIHLYERLDEVAAAELDAPFRRVSSIPCFGGGQNDVAVVRPGLLAVAYHSGNCGIGGVPATGVSLHDISDPANPVLLKTIGGLPGGTHTLTVHPSKPVIYASPGGIANGGGTQQIIDISDIAAPVVHTFQPNATGCHDFFINERPDGRTLGFCVGLTESQIWDLADPFSPVILSHIVNPLMQFHHTGVTTADGNLLVIGDETLVAQECLGGPTGAMFAYDITNPATPVPQGYFAVSRNASDNPISAQNRENWCTAHIFSFVGESRTMVSSWYTGGMNVIDWSDPLRPREVAHYQVDSGDRLGTTNYWSAYYHDGLVYANDRGRGALDVLQVEGLTDQGMDGAPSIRQDGWSSAPIAQAPAAMHAHAQQRRLLIAQGGDAALVCMLAPPDTGARVPRPSATYGGSLLA